MNSIMARAVVEIAGKPKKHIEDTMRLVIEKMRKEKDIKVKKSKVHEPKQHADIYSTFADIELEFETVEQLYYFCFEYMPSSLEIVEPEQIGIEMLEMTSSINDLLSRLHQADMKFKEATAANIILEKNLHALLKNAIKMVLKDGPNDVEELSRRVGIAPAQLIPFLESYQKDGFLKKNAEKYTGQN